MSTLLGEALAVSDERVRELQVQVRELVDLADQQTDEAGFYLRLAAKTWTWFLRDNVVLASMVGGPLYLEARVAFDEWLDLLVDEDPGTAARSLAASFKTAVPE